MENREENIKLRIAVRVLRVEVKKKDFELGEKSSEINELKYEIKELIKENNTLSGGSGKFTLHKGHRVRKLTKSKRTKK